ncbi:formimidoylglutamase [Bacillus sp. FJAT-52991]|uniref:Formimidoylglutamase n=1 Tax=Bacillus kandeliae TaxID=3129297 RepID=A0ABZ2N6Z1_9BACI
MYKASKQDLWTGRVDSVADKASYRLHQVVQLCDLNKQGLAQDELKTCAIIGFECEEGVRRNKGRTGAAAAPNEIRIALAKLPWHGPEESMIIDAGNVTCENEQLEQAQQELGKYVTKLLSNKATTIILGGGHETLYGHYLGVREFIGQGASLGIINIDAHFDLRPYDEQTSSGTMFKQILDEDLACGYLPIGIQKYGNTKALFETARRFECGYILEDEITNGNFTHVFSVIDQFAAKHDYLILTLCTDVINAAYAPGVSAPSPFGLNPFAVRTLITYITQLEKTLSFDVSEVNPSLDENNRTVSLAAHLINEAIMSFFKEEKG